MPNPYQEIGEAIADEIWVAALSEESMTEWIRTRRIDAWAGAKIRLGDPIPDVLSTIYVLQRGSAHSPMISLLRRTEVDEGTVLLRINRVDLQYTQRLWAPELAAAMDEYGAQIDGQTQELEDVWDAR